MSSYEFAMKVIVNGILLGMIYSVTFGLRK